MPNTQQIIIDYKPTDKQRTFHMATADEVLFGGAAGGGMHSHGDMPIVFVTCRPA